MSVTSFVMLDDHLSFRRPGISVIVAVPRLRSFDAIVFGAVSL